MATTNVKDLGPGKWELKLKNPGASIAEEANRRRIKVPDADEDVQLGAEQHLQRFEWNRAIDATLRQAEDPQWFIARAGRFASTAGLGTLKEACRAQSFREGCGNLLGFKMLTDMIGGSLISGIERLEAEAREELQQCRNFTQNPCTAEELQGKTNRDLASILAARGVRGFSGKRKRDLINMALEAGFTAPATAAAAEVGRIEVEKTAAPSWAFRPI